MFTCFCFLLCVSVVWDAQKPALAPLKRKKTVQDGGDYTKGRASKFMQRQMQTMQALMQTPNEAFDSGWLINTRRYAGSFGSSCLIDGTRCIWISNCNCTHNPCISIWLYEHAIVMLEQSIHEMITTVQVVCACSMAVLRSGTKSCGVIRATKLLSQ